jgi:hypothetical protein
VPVIIGNMSVVTPSNSSIIYGKTGCMLLDKITEQTKGQGLTIISNIDEDDVIEILAGETKGSLGYGLASYILDFGSVVNINSLVTNFSLYSNTNGLWSISSSNDGCVYSQPTPMMPHDKEIVFDSGFLTRYVKFDMELMSGLSASNDITGELIPLPGSPSVTSITATYTPVKEDYLYLNLDNLGTVNPSQVALSVNSNGQADIQAGVCLWNSNTWSDFCIDAQPVVQNGGRIVLLKRDGQLDDVLIDNLASIDGHIFTAGYGAWSPLADVQVYDDIGDLIESTEYKTYAREGYIVFAAKRNTVCRMQITNPSHLKIGIKITNFDSLKTPKIFGVGYTYS